MLVVSFLFGLFGQAVALPPDSVPATAVEHQMAAPTPMDCLGMTNGNDENPLPCDRMTLACMAGMGCQTPYLLETLPVAWKQPVTVSPSPLWPLTSALEGRSLQPEPHPPSPLI